MTAALAACSPSSSGETDTGADTGADTGSDTDADTGPPEPASCSPSPKGDDPLGDSFDCATYVSATPASTLEIGILNLRDEPIVIVGPQCEDESLVAVTGMVGGGRQALWPYQCSSGPTCDEMAAGEEFSCILPCPTPPPVRLAPGARYVQEWPRLAWVDANLHEDCAPAPEFAVACQVALEPPPGSYLLHTRVVRAAACDPDCACDPGEQGHCPVDAPVVDLVDASAIQSIFTAHDGACPTVDLVAE